MIFVIVTDGKKNASTKFTLEQIRSMITRQQSEHSWQFSFPAADQDAFRDGQQMGIAASPISSFSRDRIGESLDIMQHRVARQRRLLSGGETIDVNFTIEERRAMQGNETRSGNAAPVLPSPVGCGDPDLQHRGNGNPDEVGHLREGHPAVMLPDGRSGPDDGSPDQQNIDAGQRQIAQPELNGGEDQIGQQIDRKRQRHHP